MRDSTFKSFSDLLSEAGFKEGRLKRRMGCPYCTGSQLDTVAVELEREVFYCFRCGSKGSRFTLLKELGYWKDYHDEIRVRHAALGTPQDLNDVTAIIERSRDYIHNWETLWSCVHRDLWALEVDLRDTANRLLFLEEPVPEPLLNRCIAVSEGREFVAQILDMLSRFSGDDKYEFWRFMCNWSEIDVRQPIGRAAKEDTGRHEQGGHSETGKSPAS